MLYALRRARPSLHHSLRCIRETARCAGSPPRPAAFAVLAIVATGLFAVGRASAATRDLLVASRFTDNVLRYDGDTGQFIGVFASGHGLDNPNGIAYGPHGDLYVAMGDAGSVYRFDGVSGDFKGVFVAPGSGGLSAPRDLTFGPDGNLYVDSGLTNQVLKFSGLDGSFLGVAAEGQGMQGPVGLTFGPNGHMYVGAALSNAVYEFDDGAFLRSFSGGAAHRQAVGVVVDSHNRLITAQSVTNDVIGYNLVDGTPLGPVVTGGNLNTPIYMSLNPSGDLLVGSFGNDKVARYNLQTGQFLGNFVTVGSGGLDGTHDMTYMIPEPASLVLLAVGVAAMRRSASR